MDQTLSPLFLGTISPPLAFFNFLLAVTTSCNVSLFFTSKPRNKLLLEVEYYNRNVTLLVVPRSQP